VALVVALAATPLVAGPADCVPPERVRVRQVFLVPEGEPQPTPQQQDLLDRHLRWAERCYREMLGGRDTFELAEEPPLVLAGQHGLDHYRALPEGAAPQFVSEVLAALGQSRFTTPYVLVIAVTSAGEGFPRSAGGRPLNGGLNTGGGMLMISARSLEQSPNVQSTLQHELGHAFGLVHSDAYGFSMRTHTSIMSYNPNHHTRGFEPSATPGRLAPEDVRALALNDRVFPHLRFDPDTDVPEGYPMPPQVRWLGPQTIPGQVPYRIEATTTGGETHGSQVGHMLLRPVPPSQGPGLTFDGATMWHSGQAAGEWITAELTFPCEVRLSGMMVHSQHSGQCHAAQALRLEVRGADGWEPVTETELPAVDHRVTFGPREGQTWRCSFRPGESGMVVIRGLRFLQGGTEIFPPFLPCRAGVVPGAR
jgi:hypothetical protein